MWCPIHLVQCEDYKIFLFRLSSLAAGAFEDDEYMYMVQEHCSGDARGICIAEVGLWLMLTLLRDQHR